MRPPAGRAPGQDPPFSQIEEGKRATRQKVERRLFEFRGDRTLPDLADTTAILVDDGLASGFTMLAAIGALRRLGCRDVAVASAYNL